VILEKELWQQLTSPMLKTTYLSGLFYGTSILGSPRGRDSSGSGSSKSKELEDLQLTKRENPASRANFDDWLRKGNPFVDRKVVNGQVRAEDDELEDENLLADFIDEDSQLPGHLEVEHRQKSPKVIQQYDTFLMLTTSAVSVLRYAKPCQ
jgi:hypothetical protein